MKASFYNRIHILLSLAGIVVSGYLTLSHFAGRQVMCGEGGGCTSVLTGPGSKLGPIPTAAFGLALYLLLFVLALKRSLRGEPNEAKSSQLSLYASSLGFSMSLGLTMYAVFVLISICNWCLSSLGIMTLLMISSIFLANAEEDQTDPRPGDRQALLVGAILAAGAFSFLAYTTTKAVPLVAQVSTQLIGSKPEDFVIHPSTLQGDPTAKVTILEYADFFCGGCRSTHPMVKELIARSRGKVRHAFIPFPLFALKDHELSLPASLMLIQSVPSGKYAQVVDTFFSGDVTRFQNIDTFVKDAVSLGLDEAQLRKGLDPNGSDAMDQLDKAMSFAKKMGVVQTPSFIVFVEGKDPQLYQGFEAVMENPDVMAVAR